MPRRAPTTARIGGRSGGRGSRSASVAATQRHTRDGERRDDFDIRQKWWTGDALPEAKLAVANSPGYPRPRWRAVQRESHGNLGDTIAQFRADLARVLRK